MRCRDRDPLLIGDRLEVQIVESTRDQHREQVELDLGEEIFMQQVTKPLGHVLVLRGPRLVREIR